MYIPTLNRMTDRSEIVQFMRRFSFATLITAQNNLPVATPLPFLVEERGDSLVLSAHLAKANRQWEHLAEGHPVLVIFAEPHAYISPSHYDPTVLNVPTWNYIAVHAYGKGSLLTSSEQVFALLNATIAQYEEAYVAKWNSMPDTYKQNLANGIVAFEIEVDELQAKKKLSQNKTEAEQTRIIEALAESSNTHEQLIAAYMYDNKKKE